MRDCCCESSALYRCCTKDILLQKASSVQVTPVMRNLVNRAWSSYDARVGILLGSLWLTGRNQCHSSLWMFSFTKDTDVQALTRSHPAVLQSDLERWNLHCYLLRTFITRAHSCISNQWYFSPIFSSKLALVLLAWDCISLHERLRLYLRMNRGGKPGPFSEPLRASVSREHEFPKGRGLSAHLGSAEPASDANDVSLSFEKLSSQICAGK